MSAVRSRRPLVSPFVVAVGLALVGACDPASRSASEPAPSPAESSEPAQPPAAPPEPVPAPDEFALRVQAVAGTRAGQVELAALLLDALDRDAPADVGAALRALGRRLSEYRADRYEAVLVRALQRFAAAESATIRRRVDGRLVVPAVEVMLDVRDRAAIERLAESHGDGPAGPMLANARDLARRFPDADLPLVVGDVPPSCSLVVDGHRVETDRATVALGSHTLACGDGDRTLVEVRPPGARVDLVSDELVVSVPVE